MRFAPRLISRFFLTPLGVFSASCLQISTPGCLPC
jgi:hypothetical protein